MTRVLGIDQPPNMSHVLHNQDLFLDGYGRALKNTERAFVMRSLDKTLTELKTRRQNEGANMLCDLARLLASIARETEYISQKAPKISADYEKRLRDRMKEYLKGAGLEESRVAAEAAVYADKTDVTEELSRQNSHIKELTRLFNAKQCNGKKIDFFLQEMMREANTLCAKISDFSAIKRAINIKTTVESMREIVRNVE